MAKTQSVIIKIVYVLGNLTIFSVLLLLLVNNIVLPEIFLALVLVQLLVSGFFFTRYLMYKSCNKLALSLKFRLVTTGFLEQARFEGMYKKNWWQIHFASRPYGEYWGMPRTYIKLQYKEKKKFDNKILKKYTNNQFNGLKIDSIEHVVRPYKNYLLMKLTWFVFNKEKLQKLMDFLIKISRESQLKKRKS